MKCFLLPDRRMPRDSNLEVDHLLIRTGGSALSHGLTAIIPGSNVSVADSSDICNHVARSRTLPYRLNQLVGFSSRTVANREMVIIKRETHLDKRETHLDKLSEGPVSEYVAAICGFVPRARFCPDRPHGCSGTYHRSVVPLDGCRLPKLKRKCGRNVERRSNRAE